LLQAGLVRGEVPAPAFNDGGENPLLAAVWKRFAIGLHRGWNGHALPLHAGASRPEHRSPEQKGNEGAFADSVGARRAPCREFYVSVIMAEDQVTGWKLPPGEKDRLLELVPPLFANLVADHVTLRTRTGADTPLPTETCAEVIGEVDDGEGVQALIVEIGGGTSPGRSPRGGGRRRVTM
jgi:hypothetical protein